MIPGAVVLGIAKVKIMAFGKGKIWFDGKMVDWNDAKIHVLSHVIHYGSSLFESMRCYNTKKGSVIFRMQAHIDRQPQWFTTPWRINPQRQNDHIQAQGMNDLGSC